MYKGPGPFRPFGISVLHVRFLFLVEEAKTTQLPSAGAVWRQPGKGIGRIQAKKKDKCTRHRIKVDRPRGQKKVKRGGGHETCKADKKSIFRDMVTTGTNGAAGSSAGIVFCLYAVRRPRTEEGEKHTNDTNERGTTRRREGKEQTQKTMRTPSMSWVTIFLVPGGMTPRMACC